MKTLEEKQKIKNSLIETRERRKNQSIKVIELKVNCHQTSKETFQKMNFVFTQAKWIVNEMIRLGETQNFFDYNYLEHKEVVHLDKDGNEIKTKLEMPSILHRGIVNQKKQDIVNESNAKKKGKKVGKLKYKKEINSIDILTGPWIKIRDNSHITIPGFANLKVYGLDQRKKYKEYELANAKFIRKPSGFYIHIAICVPKTNNVPKKTYKEVGLDFGIKDNIITSDGEKFNCKVPESDYLKFLQKQLKRKQKGSKHYYKLRNQIQKEYEHLSNKKTDETNKLIHYLIKNYDVIYFQDEQISSWRKFSKGFARNIQHSYLGRVKAKLIELQKSNRSFEISKWSPSTKFCPCCGSLNTGITLADRIYRCDCGYQFDRDTHAARNVKLFGSTKRAECLEQASVETLASAALDLSDVSKLSRRSENEGSSL